MITTTGIYHIGIPVNDVERAVKFYTEVLGMKIAKLNRDDMGDHLNRADLRCGDGMVVLFQRPTPVEKRRPERGRRHPSSLRCIARRLRAGGAENERLGRQDPQRPDGRASLRQRLLLLRSRW